MLNKLLSSLLWQRCPKTVFSSGNHLDHALADTALHFIVERVDMGSYFHYWDLILVSTLQNSMRLVILDVTAGHFCIYFL